jgi:hypothetical protein
MKAIFYILVVSAGFFSANAIAGTTFAPYYSLRSTKKINTNKKDKSQEDTVNKTREEYGLKAGISMGRLFKTEFSIGQSILTVTEKTRDAVDEFDEINYVEDLNMDTSDPDRDVKTTDELLNARFGIAFDPSFSVFIIRTKLGVQATKRKLTFEQFGSDPVVEEPPIVYKPYAGAGLGIRFSPKMFFMVEYAGYFYKFPELEPFQREVTVSYSVAIGK